MLDLCSSHYIGFRLTSVLPTYKIAVLTYKLRSTSTPPYLSTLLQFVTSSRSLRSVDSFRLQVQRTRTEFGRRAFSIAAPTVWNALPNKLTQSSSLPIFKKHLKSLLFNTTLTRQYHSSLCILTTSRHYTNSVIIITCLLQVMTTVKPGIYEYQAERWVFPLLQFHFLTVFCISFL